MVNDRRQLALLATLALAGCGGGGGDSSGNPPSAPPPPAGQLRLDETNAPKAAKLLLDGIETALLAGDSLQLMSSALVATGLNPLPFNCGAVGTADIRYV